MDTSISKQSHHEQQELCSTRPSYRQGRKLTAVKVYTVSDESTHLLVSRVPAIRLHAELSALCSRFGTLACCALVPDYDNQEPFVQTYHVQYARLQSARFAKRQLDGRSFYGGVLHVCYAPELETVPETRAKLVLRRKEVASRVRKRGKPANHQRNISVNNSTATAYSAAVFTLPQSPVIQESPRSLATLPVQPPSAFPLNNMTQKASILTAKQETTASCPYTPQPVAEAEPSLNVPKNPPSQGPPRFIPRQVSVSKRIVFHKKSC